MSKFMSKITGAKRLAFLGAGTVLLIALGVVLGQSISAVVSAQDADPNHG